MEQAQPIKRPLWSTRELLIAMVIAVVFGIVVVSSTYCMPRCLVWEFSRVRLQQGCSSCRQRLLRMYCASRAPCCLCAW